MSSIIFVIAIAAVGLVIFWYVFDEATRGGQAESGLLTMRRERDSRQNDTQPGWKPSGKRPWRIGR